MSEDAQPTQMKVEAVVLRERVEIVINAVEEEAAHVGVTVVEAVGHGRQRGITHEYRGRTFESRFLPKAHLTFITSADKAPKVIEAIVSSGQSGHESGDGLVYATPIQMARHIRTGNPLAEGGAVGATS